MIKPKEKICVCGYKGFFPGKKCKKCKYEESKQNTKANPKPKKKAWRRKRKATGEGEVFRRIWKLARESTNGPCSFVSEKSLGLEAFAWYFSHVLDKNNFDEARLDEENIALMTLQEHELWEYHQYKLIDDPKWKHVFELKHKLLKKYGYSIPPDEERIYKED